MKPTGGEFGLIAWLRERAAAGNGVTLGIGDDCSILRPTAGASILVTTDMLMDGRHFRLGEATAAEVGHKAMAVNLSDIAAMAGKPIAAFVAVALPKGTAVEVAQGLYAGMAPLAESFGVTLAGGDTNAWDGPLVICVTLVGEATGKGPVTRSGAKVGDSILVTGPLGGSLLGRHLRPIPRIREALALHEVADLHSMIDISDGLLADLGHILEESGVGATLDAASIPIHPDAVAMSVDGRSPLDHALNDGEDFELCLTLDPTDAAWWMGSFVRSAPRTMISAPADPTRNFDLFSVGVIEAEPGLRIRYEDGSVVPVQPRGFDHLGSP